MGSKALKKKASLQSQSKYFGLSFKSLSLRHCIKLKIKTYNIKIKTHNSELQGQQYTTTECVIYRYVAILKKLQML